jgi:hypothetical protein
MSVCLFAIFACALAALIMESYRHREIRRLAAEIGRLGLEAAQATTARDAWKSYALGYEVFCEATYDGDTGAILNAGSEIAAARAKLQSLGQYDA